MLLLIAHFLVLSSGQEYPENIQYYNTQLVPTYSLDGVRRSVEYEAPHVHTVCESNKPDALSSFATILGSVGKILLGLVLLKLLKLLAIKSLILPFKLALIAKLAVKAVLLWPFLKKMMKALRKKKRKKSRMEEDCSRRMACVVQKVSEGGLSTQIGAAFVTALADYDEDSPYFVMLMNLFASDSVAQCMTLPCDEGVDIS